MNLRPSSPPILAIAAFLAVVAWAQSDPATNRSNLPGPTDTPPPMARAPAPGPAVPAMPAREFNFGTVDTDHDKRVSLSEFSAFVESRMADQGGEAISDETIQRFRLLDRNKDAYLSEEESRAIGTAQPAPGR